MPLQNRVDPFGELFTHPARGIFMGNRGGRFHTAARTLTARRWASRQWICCVLAFKGRHRNVWGRFYTERLQGRAKYRHRHGIDGLPDGAFIAMDGTAFAVSGDTLLHWTPEGYDARVSRPRGTIVEVLTPPAILGVLAAGYRPHWHSSALLASLLPGGKREQG
jgi:hypothetical protein